jgi:undecaprenyl diphosphate synthase
MSFKEKIDPKRIPLHIAIIMDGNGRWAKQRGKLRVFGHESGVTAVRETAETCAEIGVKFLTLYAFSTENWNRPKMEVDALMNLLVKTLNKETKTLMDNNIRLGAIGDLTQLDPQCREQLQETMDITSGNNKMDMNLALSYSSRWEITEATRKIAEMVKTGQLEPEDISQELFSSMLTTKNIPDPELLIRTSGENRISNFLLWQIAYAELYFTPVLWPDFRREHLYEAIYDFQHRERRFGKISEQLNPSIK